MKSSAVCEGDRTLAQVIEDRVRSKIGREMSGIEDPKPDYKGKVRDVFVKNQEMLILTTDRASAFDVVLGAVPFKGSLLTEQAVFWLEKSKSVIKNHLLERLSDQVILCKKAKPLKVEMVVRGFLAGSLQREDPETRGSGYGLKLDPSLKQYQAFEKPIVTPTTKADVGHDAPISLKAIVEQGLVSQKHLDQIVETSLALFQLGSQFSKERGLLLVDTKYEFGLVGDGVVLIDEIHTADSSRYWLLPSYEERFQAQQAPEMLDKERLRSTLLKRGYNGEDISTLPSIDEEMKMDLSCQYWKLTEMLLGKRFIPSEKDSVLGLKNCILDALSRMR